MNKYIAIFLILIFNGSMAASCAAEPDKYSKVYIDESVHIYLNSEEVLKLKVGTVSPMVEFKTISKNIVFIIFSYEPSDVVGDYEIYAYDSQADIILDHLELYWLEEISDGENPVVFAGDNRFSFYLPVAPLWPVQYSFQNNKFIKAEEVNDLKLNNLIVETEKYITLLLQICDDIIKGCDYEKDYENALKQLKAANKLIKD